jgi:hypothetical protein
MWNIPDPHHDLYHTLSCRSLLPAISVLSSLSIEDKVEILHIGYARIVEKA